MKPRNKKGEGLKLNCKKKVVCRYPAVRFHLLKKRDADTELIRKGVET
jgi:hypothetical protein